MGKSEKRELVSRLTVLLLQGFTLDNAMGWNAQSWSISVELWLYLAMALAWRASDYLLEEMKKGNL